MELVSVESSQISAVGFDASADKMQVLFRRGGLYEYRNVSVHEYNQVLTAKSVEIAFRQIIKGIKLFTKIEQNEQPELPAAKVVHESVPSDPKVQQVSASSLALVEQAKAVTVADAAQQERASELLLSIAQMRREIADTFKPMKDAAFKTHRTICDQEKGLDAPLLEAEQTLKRAIGGFVAEQQRLARAAEEADRQRLRKDAERKAREESERLAIEDAIDLESEGRHEEAEAVLASPLPVAPAYIAPAPVVPEVARVKGVSTREVAKFRIVDEEKVPREYLVVNESAIRAIVARTSGKIRIPGVDVYFEQQVAASRRA